MTLVIETGGALANAESYVSAVDCATYAVNHGLSFEITDVAAAEAALRRAVTFIDAFRFRFPGYRTNRRLQALEWPRVGAYTSLPQGGRGDTGDIVGDFDAGYRGYSLGYDYIAPNVIPIEVINAQCEAAVRELAKPGSMQPDLVRGGGVQSLSAGSVRIVYGANADPRTTFQLINGILAPILMSGNGHRLFGTAARG